MRPDYDFPEFVFTKWQKLIDLLSSTFDLPATLIMQADETTIEVFAKCSTDGNPYSVGESEKMAGLYCETVVKSKDKLLVTNALSDKDWDKNPDIKLGMIAYLGFPIQLPSGDVFGTICVLDNKENPFSKTIENFLLQVKEIIELDIFAYYSYAKASDDLEKGLFQQFREVGLNNKTQPEIEVDIKSHNSLHEIMGQKLSQFKKELLDQENKYEILFSSTNSALVVFEPVFNSEGDVFDAKYIDMNANNEAIIGYKKDEVIGRTILEIFPETEDYWFENFDFVVKTKKSFQTDSYYKVLGKHFSLNAFSLDDNTFAISCDDVSAQEILKQKLEESERRYKTIFHESSSIMMLVDPFSGTVVDVNSAALKFYGYSKEEIVGMNMNDINILSREDLEKTINLATKKKKTHFLFKHRLASGEIRDVEVYSGAIGANGQTLLHSVIHDVTESREAMGEVNRLSMAVEQSPVAIAITNIKGDIIYCNPKHCELTGYSNDELMGANPKILKSGKFSQSDYKSLWGKILSGEKWNGEFFNKKKDGSFYWELASIAPIKNELGEIVNYMKIGEDISERKRLENQLSQSILRAEESDKLKNSFLANLSHEIRTPLNGIMGFTNLLLSDGISEEERREYVTYIESSGNQLITMMDDILKISVIEVGQLSVKNSCFSVNDLCVELETYYLAEIKEKGLELIIDCTCKNIVRNDRQRVRQVLDNLVRNAIKFTEQGRIALKAECNNNMLLISLEDTGIGIAKHDHQKIFDRFSQVSGFSTRKFDGAGLGLAISKEVIALLGGEIWLESQIGKGTKFTFTIPNIIEKRNEDLFLKL
jgi:PAS domain S-box-containing protein